MINYLLKKLSRGGATWPRYAKIQMEAGVCAFLKEIVYLKIAGVLMEENEGYRMELLAVGIMAVQKMKQV